MHLKYIKESDNGWWIFPLGNLLVCIYLRGVSLLGKRIQTPINIKGNIWKQWRTRNEVNADGRLRRYKSITASNNVVCRYSHITPSMHPMAKIPDIQIGWRSNLSSGGLISALRQWSGSRKLVFAQFQWKFLKTLSIKLYLCERTFEKKKWPLPFLLTNT